MQHTKYETNNTLIQTNQYLADKENVEKNIADLDKKISYVDGLEQNIFLWFSQESRL